MLVLKGGATIDCTNKYHLLENQLTEWSNCRMPHFRISSSNFRMADFLYEYDIGVHEYSNDKNIHAKKIYFAK